MSAEILKSLRLLVEYEPSTGYFRCLGPGRGLLPSGALCGHKEANGYIRMSAGGRYYLAHRLAWLFTYGDWPTGNLDHINGIRHDNRVSNLRVCSPSENMQNLASASKSAAGLRGAFFNRPAGRWYSQIRVKGKKFHLGMYDTAELAHEAYVKAKESMHTFCPRGREASNGL